MGRIRTWVLIAVAALLVAVPTTSAKSKHIKLTGVVVGQTTSKGLHYTIVSVREGSKKVGKLGIGPTSCGGNICTASGSANLKVGRITGKANLSLRWLASGTGCVIGAPTCKPAKYATGKIFRQGSSGPEAIRVNAPKIPKTKGSHFGIVLG